MNRYNSRSAKNCENYNWISNYKSIKSRGDARQLFSHDKGQLKFKKGAWTLIFIRHSMCRVTYEFLGSSSLRSWRASFMCKLRRQCFTRHIHAPLRYYRERLCGTSPREFVTRAIPRNLLLANGRPHLATFPRGLGLYLNHFSLTIISALEGISLIVPR